MMAPCVRRMIVRRKFHFHVMKGVMMFVRRWCAGWRGLQPLAAPPLTPRREWLAMGK